MPGFFALGLVIGGVVEPPARETLSHEAVSAKSPLNSVLKRYLVVVAIFSFANSSDAFILLRAKDLGYSLAEILGMIVLLNIVSATTAIPAAVLSDRFGRRTLIALGWIIYAAAYFMMGSELFSHTRVLFVLTIAIYGLFYGFTESVEKAWIADLAPRESRGRAYGIFGLIVGMVALPASVGFGWVWDHWGGEIPFMVSGAIAMVSTGLLFLWVRE